MHSFGLTERWFVLAEFPFVVNPLRLALSGRPYIENYRWKPELGTRFTLIDRPSGEADRAVRDRRRGSASTTSTPTRTDGEVVVDICVFDDAGIVEDLYLDRLRAGKPVAQPAAAALPDPARRRARSSDERLVEQSFELPRINYGRCNERPYRYAWGVGIGGSRLVRRGSSRPTSSERDDRRLVGARLLSGRARVRRRSRRRGRGRRRAALGRARLRARDSFLLVLDARDARGARARRGAAPHPVRLPRPVRRRLTRRARRRPAVSYSWLAMAETGTFRVKRGLAEMLKGGVIMDVTTADQARIAEDAGRRRGDGARAGAGRHPRRGRRRPDGEPARDQGDPGGGDDPGDGQGADRPLRRGAGAAVARGRLHRRVRGPDPGRRGQPHRQARLRGPVRLRRDRTSARRCAGSARGRR